MHTIDSLNNISTAQLLKQKNKIDTIEKTQSFAKQLKSAIDEVNELQKDSQKAMSDIATGEVKDLHQAALAISKAETSMKLMLEIRNKALSAYKDISHMQL
jgi:flagellar hook-basal body complex protein FliE